MGLRFDWRRVGRRLNHSEDISFQRKLVNITSPAIILQALIARYLLFGDVNIDVPKTYRAVN